MEYLKSGPIVLVRVACGEIHFQSVDRVGDSIGWGQESCHRIVERSKEFGLAWGVQRCATSPRTSGPDYVIVDPVTHEHFDMGRRNRLALL